MRQRAWQRTQRANTRVRKQFPTPPVKETSYSDLQAPVDFPSPNVRAPVDCRHPHRNYRAAKDLFNVGEAASFRHLIYFAPTGESLVHFQGKTCAQAKIGCSRPRNTQSGLQKCRHLACFSDKAYQTRRREVVAHQAYQHNGLRLDHRDLHSRLNTA